MAHQYLASAIQDISPTASPGLIGGMSGLNFTVQYLSLNGQRYQKAQQSLDNLLAACLANTLTLLRREEGTSDVQYDQISGVSGMARYLLNARADPALASNLTEIIDWLIERSEMEDAQGFYTPPEMVTEKQRERSPHLVGGYVNCGLAHGVPGPLALLSITVLEGLDRPYLHDAVRKLADWLVARHYDDSYGINWPTFYVEEDNRNDKTRTAWCYGLPGVVRALFLAGNALDDRRLQDLAASALLSVEKRPLGVRGIDSPTFCHGIAGLLQIVLRFANDTGDPDLTRFAESLVDQLVALHDPEAPLGFRDIETRGSIVDSPGLLTGALSPALVLLAASSDIPPDWDQAFLLS